MKFDCGMQILQIALDLVISVTTNFTFFMSYFLNEVFLRYLSYIVHLLVKFLFGGTDRPIASIAFRAHGELLAVASGHKVRICCRVDSSSSMLFLQCFWTFLYQLYIWQYNKRGETSSPAIVLKTRRSLRAVHFHPHGAPFLLTAEVMT